MLKKGYKSVLVKVGVITLLSTMVATTIYAEEKIVKKQISEGGLTWTSSTGGGNFMLRVTGPEGFFFEQTFKGNPPTIATFGPDGQYRYEITALPVVSDEVKTNMRKAREKNDRTAMRSFQKKSQKQSGYFRVQGGTLLNSDLKETRSTK